VTRQFSKKSHHHRKQKIARVAAASLRSKRFGKAFRTFDALFAFFDRGKIGAGAKKCVVGEEKSLPLPRHALSCARPNFRAAKKQKMPRTCGKPYGNACYVG